MQTTNVKNVQISAFYLQHSKLIIHCNLLNSNNCDKISCSSHLMIKIFKRDCDFSFLTMYALYQCLELNIQTYDLNAEHYNSLHFECRICDCYEFAIITLRSSADVLAKNMSEWNEVLILIIIFRTCIWEIKNISHILNLI